MYTTLLAMVLTVQGSTQAAEISWSQDYAQAYKQCAAEKKPMAVIFGNGEMCCGCGELVRDGGLSKEASELMSTHYICVYVDTSSPKGKQLAKSFGMPSGKGIVLSDRAGAYQKYAQEGTVANRDLVIRLKIHSIAEVTTSTSSYRAVAAQPQGTTAVQPAANYCPSCQGGTRYR